MERGLLEREAYSQHQVLFVCLFSICFEWACQDF